MNEDHVDSCEALISVVVDTAFHIHKDLGPGLLESVYEAVLASELIRKGMNIERQKPVTFEYNSIRYNEGFRVDILVNNTLVIELKSTEALAPVHYKQLLTYLRLMNLKYGILINFGAGTFKEGVKRILNTT